MKVIYIKDLKGHGKKDDIKEEKDGYAKYLITNGYAVKYTTGSVDILNDEIKDRNEKEKQLVEECNIIKEKLEKLTLTFKVKTGLQDRVFGTISSKQIETELNKLGYKIDKKKISIDGEINTLGVHIVKVLLHRTVIAELKINLTK